VWGSVIWGERSTRTEEEHSEDGGDDVETVDGSGSGGGDMVRQQKDLLWKEVVKNEQASLVDLRLQDHIGEHRWQHIVASFVGKHVFQHVFQYFEWSRSIFFTVEFVLDIIKKHILQYVGNTNKRSRVVNNPRVVNSSPTSLVEP
jgi:hypothetical protein